MVAAISHEQATPQKGGPWGRVWKPEELEIIKANYEGKSVRAIMKLLPNRSKSAIMAMGGKLGLQAAKGHKRWEPHELQYLLGEWEFSTVAAIAKGLNRSQASVIKRAMTMELYVGPPEGAESLMSACRRTGFTSLNMLKKILAFSEVEIFPCKTYPKSWKNRVRRKAWKRNKKKTPERKACDRHYVWIEEVDEAAAHWVKNAEVVGPAATKRGINKVRLRKWLEAAGEERPSNNCLWWVSTATIDRVVAANLALMVGRDTLTAIAHRIGIGWQITKRWVTEAGLKSILSPLDDFEFLFITSEVERVIAERSKNNARVVINGERPASPRQIERRRKSMAWTKKREAFAMLKARLNLLKTLRKLERMKVKAEKLLALEVKRRNSLPYKRRQLETIMVAVGLPRKFIKLAKRRLSNVQQERLPPVEKGVGSPLPKANVAEKRLV